MGLRDKTVVLKLSAFDTPIHGIEDVLAETSTRLRYANPSYDCVVGSTPLKYHNSDSLRCGRADAFFGVVCNRYQHNYILSPAAQRQFWQVMSQDVSF